ncbi:carotenoid oxygenase family protein [Algoriphagus sediminis]|uniref:Carotenoid oxygenase family protein n=1 Tax=Algoriphagus sediminis TaxID=3057113 RepID=A0ABT7Y862_9BACT|nr:carotenoid oxygenase family protein [Algoriphagus sediminis]MDN3202696.1 carotenoid oxygenase family protein [Algoriphagus sediminis]
MKRFFSKVIDFFKRLFSGNTKSLPEIDPNQEPLLKTSRNEIEGRLEVIEGEFPKDMLGACQISLPVGTVNSGGLPFPAKNHKGHRNPEYGSPIMNGDGMVIQVNLAPETPTVKTKLMKTPCYYADEATKEGTKHHGLMGFHNMGITRMSMVLGSRNELNTATQPVKFKGQKVGSLMATYDVGRPYLVDPKTLELVSPVGKVKEWMTAEPPMVPWPFGIVQTSAHPGFDPITQELFTVNYSKNKKAYTHLEQSYHHLKHNRADFKEKLEGLANEVVDHPDDEHVKAKVDNFFDKLNHHVDGKPHDKDEPKGDVFMNLIRWDGTGSFVHWELSDQTGDKLAIYECMHQMGLTKDYLILTDCSFKFSLDMLFDNPFPESKIIERLIRRLATVRMEPFTTTYIIRRRDLKPEGGKAIAYRLDHPIPLETIHYSCDYDNPDGVVTLYGVHNAATCIAEWVRTFDRRALDGKPVDPDYYSLFAVGSMDISRFGKWKFDAENLKLLKDESKVFEEPGKYKEDHLGPNTWAVALYTYRGILSAEKPVNKIKQIWFVSDGTVKNLLTKFVYELYEDYPHRKLSLHEIKDATERELPFGLTRVNTDTMEPEDYYQCDRNTFLRGVQFVERKTRNENVPEEMDGYLFCPVQVGNSVDSKPTKYSSEFWVFDATDVAKGPICKLKNDEVKFAFTLHTSWIPNAEPSDQQYIIKTKEDYDEAIKDLDLGVDRGFLEKFFEENVYPHFEHNR